MRTSRRVARCASALVLAGLLSCGGESTGPEEPPPVTAKAVAIVDAPPATAQSGVPFAAAPRVRLVDEHGGPVRTAGVAITATVDFGLLTGTATATTGADGTAQFPGLGVSSLAATRTISFTATGLTPARHQLAITAGPAAAVAAVSPTMQSAIAGTNVTTSPAVKVTDGAGNPIAGALVTFAITAGGGTLTGESAATSASGIATAGSWTLGDEPGMNAVEASVQGLAQKVTFQASAPSTAPARVELYEGATQTADLGAAVPVRPAVRVVDAEGRPVAGVVVTFDVLEGDGSWSGGVQVTDASGIARVGTWIIGSLVMRYRMQAVVPGLEGSPVIFEAIGRGIGNLSVHAGGEQSGIVGAPVAVRPAARVLDRFGQPVAGVPVAFSVASGGGSVTGAAQVTDASGIATVGGWTLGTLPGPNTLRAEAADVGGSPVTFTANGEAAPPTSRMSAHAGIGQTARIRTAVPEAPAVVILTAEGQPVPNHPVTFTAEGGTITVTNTVTDANGIASAGTWTLSEKVGTHDVVATASGVLGSPVRFQAVATAGPPARVFFGGSADIFNSVVGAATQFIPTAFVVDEGDNPLSGVTVTFSVASGSVSGSVKQTTADGWAKPDAWVLGTQAGQQLLTATVAGLTPATRAINAIPGPVTSMTIVSGDGQSAGVRRLLPEDLVVQYRDQYANPVPGQSIQVTPPAGDQISGMQSSGADGIARFRVRLGSITGPQSIVASHPTEPVSVTFSATANPVHSQYAIELRYLTPISSSQQVLFEAAAARWSDIILGDVPDLPTTIGAGACIEGQPAINEVVDDIVVYIDVRPIDGPDNILGGASLCALRATSRMPAVASILLDAADVAAMESNGMLKDVIIHELGHTIGISGLVWSQRGLLSGAGGFNPVFTGGAAMAAYAAAGGGGTVPVENTGGPGTADTHWRESELSIEVMTGYISPINRLSAITIGSLADLGYEVDYGTAEEFGIGPSFLRGAVPEVRRLRELPQDRPVIIIREDGTVVGQGR